MKSVGENIVLVKSQRISQLSILIINIDSYESEQHVLLIINSIIYRGCYKGNIY